MTNTNENTETKAGPEPTHLLYGHVPVYAPTALEFLRVLDDKSIPETNKIYPPLIFVDWNEVEKTHRIVRMGIPARWNAKTFSAILAGWTPPAAELDKLRQLQAAYESENAKYNNFSNQAAAEFWKGQVNQPHREPGENPNRTLSAIQNDFRIRRRGIDAAIKTITQQSAELAAPIIESAFDEVRGGLIETESNEREKADEFSIPWIPSYVWRCHAAILLQMSNRPTIGKLHQGAHPRNMLAGIAEL